MKVNNHFVIHEFRNPSGRIAQRVYGRLPGGQVIRENFQTYQEAVARWQELEIELLNTENLSLRPTRLSAQQLGDAEAALNHLNGRRHTLVECVDHFLKTWKPAQIEMDLADAFREFMGAKKAENLRGDSLTNLRTRVGRLVRAHPARRVGQIQVDDIRAAVNNPRWSAITRGNERRALHSFFAWAVDQKYCAENPVSKLKPPRVKRGEPQVLSLSDVSQQFYRLEVP